MAKLNENKNISSLDIPQMQQRVFDESMDAQRVVLVGGEIIIPEIKFPENFGQGNSCQCSSKQEPIIVKVPEIIIQKEIVYVDKPIIIEKGKEIKIEYIEKPIIVKEIEQVIVEKFKEPSNTLSLFAKICMVVQTLAILGLCISHILK